MKTKPLLAALAMVPHLLLGAPEDRAALEELQQSSPEQFPRGIFQITDFSTP